MNETSRPLFPRFTLWLVIAGVLLGWLGTMVFSLSEDVKFESVTLVRPVPPPSTQPGSPQSEWVKAEAAAMGTSDNLLRVVRNLNLDAEWNMTPENCVERLRKMITIETASGDTLIRVKAGGPKSMESADLVNAVVAARREFYLEKNGPIPTPGGKEYDQRVLLTARVETLEVSSLRKKVALRDALEKTKLMPEFGKEEALKTLALTGELEKLRADWLAEAAQFEKAKAGLAVMETPTPRAEYAEILEKGMPAINPVDPGIRARYSLWTTTGAVAGLLLSLVLGRFGKPVQNRPRTKAQRPPPVEY